MKKLFLNMAVLGSTVMIMVLLAEVVLRVYQPSALNRSHHKLFVEHNARLGWSLSPNNTALHVTSEYEVTEQVNSRGLRGPEFAYIKNPGERRILVLGDSFAEGYSVEFENLFSEVLRRRMVTEGCDYTTVINSGTGGYATDQEYLFFIEEGARYNPDLTILLVYSNDIRDNIKDRHWRGFKPMFHLEDGELTLTNVPVPEPIGETELMSPVGSNFFRKTRLWLNANFRLYGLIREAIIGNHNLHLLAIKLGLADRPSGDGPLIRVPDELKIWSKEYDSDTQHAWDVTGTLIGALKRATFEAGSDLLVVYVPVWASIYRDGWEATKAKYGLSDSEWSIHQVGLELKGICGDQGIDFIDPTNAFLTKAEELEKRDRRLYYPLDRHWTLEGHRLTADLLYNHIFQRYRYWFEGPASAQK